MALSMLPVSAFAAQPEEALYAQMLELGLVDGDGTLIKDSTFTVEDGTRLSSLDELVEWLNQCGEDDLDTRITVDATGRSATAEQFMYALSIEYQMADLAQTLSRLASGSGSVSPMSAGSSVDTTVHDLILAPSVERDGNILTFHIGLYDKKDVYKRQTLRSTGSRKRRGPFLQQGAAGTLLLLLSRLHPQTHPNSPRSL